MAKVDISLDYQNLSSSLRSNVRTVLKVGLDKQIENIHIGLTTNRAGDYLRYYYPELGHSVWSSMPGDPPRKQTGRLASLKGSITDIKTKNEIGVRYTIHDKIAYWLEYGTRIMAPRPFMKYGMWTSYFNLIKSLKTSKLFKK